ncbi:MAG: HlyD family efflux transporter periplasmic adaptor subunit [Epsilonproteobacteria bacterium]|nr:HlyD family efflux transporter periplasmic adaptor subunit [Campylobacterota bacterium]
MKLATFLCTLMLLLAQGEPIPADLPTAPVRVADRLYIGSFLAVGYLPAKGRYVLDAPIEGVVEGLEVDLFDPVQKGQLIATIKSPKILEIEGEYLKALIEYDYYRNEVKRLKPLSEAAIVPKKRYLQARNELLKFQSQVHSLKNLLLDWGLEREQVARITRTRRPDPILRLRAPIDGRVSDLAINPKLYLHQGDHMLTITSPQGTIVKVALPLAVTKELREGGEIHLNGHLGRIQRISPLVDEESQTRSVMIQAPLKLLPGQKERVSLYLPKAVLVVPSTAIVEIQGESGLFVKGEGGFSFVPVQILARTKEQVYIRSSQVRPGDLVAIEGVISLKGALEGDHD